MYVYLAIALAILVSGFTGGWKIRDWKAAKDDQARIEQTAKELAIRAQRVDTAAVSHEDFKSKSLARERVIVREVDRVVKEPVYLNQCFDDDGLRILASDIASRVPASGEPKTSLPAASSPGL